LAGRRGLVRIRVSEAGVVIELERDQLLALVQTDSELGKCVPDRFFTRCAGNQLLKNFFRAAFVSVGRCSINQCPVSVNTI